MFNPFRFLQLAGGAATWRDGGAEQATFAASNALPKPGAATGVPKAIQDFRRSGANNPSRETVGSVTTKQLREIAEAKMADLSANDVDQAMKIILGSAKSMGIEVK